MRATPALFLLALTTAACSGGDDATDDGDEMVNCTLVTDDDEFVVGLSKAGANAHYDFALMAADPAPPSFGDNTWHVQVTAGGAPVSDAAITVFPFMPKHGHTTPTPVVVSPETAPGQYKLDPVNFWMPGVWEVTIEATSDGVTDSALFRFCIPS